MTYQLSLEVLRYAQAVARTESFSAAARAYGVTQPALSNGIAKLEGHLGQLLFTRSPRGVTPTDFGDHLLPLIDRALGAIDTIEDEARRYATAEQNSIHMGVSPLINPQLVARAYTAVCELDHQPDLVLREANMEDLRSDLLAGSLDVILIPAVMPLEAFSHRLIDSEPVVIVSSHSAGYAPLELTETIDTPFILVPNSCGLTTFTTDLFASHDLPIKTYPGEAASYQVLEQWANLGLGAALLPSSKLSSPHAPHQPLREDGRDVEIAYEAVWHPDSPIAQDINLLTQRLQEASNAIRATLSAE